MLPQSKSFKEHILWETDDTGKAASKLSLVHSISDSHQTSDHEFNIKSAT